MLCALVGNSSERSLHPGWSGAHSCRDAEMRSRRSDGGGSTTAARAATLGWRHSPRSSTWYAMVSAMSPPPAEAITSKFVAFILSPVRRNPRKATIISQNTQDNTALLIMCPAKGVRSRAALAIGRLDMLVGIITIALDDTGIIIEQLLCPYFPATWHVAVSHHWRIHPTMRAVITRYCP